MKNSIKNLIRVCEQELSSFKSNSDNVFSEKSLSELYVNMKKGQILDLEDILDEYNKDIDRDALAIDFMKSGILSNYAIGQKGYDALADDAYKLADAMIERRKEK